MSLPSRPLPTLESLPVELHFEIINYLEIEDLIALAQMSRYFNAICDPYGPVHREDLMDLIVFAEQNFRQHREKNNFVCMRCLRFLPPDAFAVCETRGRKARWGPEAEFRMCMGCELQVRPCQRVTRENMTLCSCDTCATFHEEFDRRAREGRGIPVSEDLGVLKTPIEEINEGGLSFGGFLHSFLALKSQPNDPTLPGSS